MAGNGYQPIAHQFVDPSAPHKILLPPLRVGSLAPLVCHTVPFTPPPLSTSSSHSSFTPLVSAVSSSSSLSSSPTDLAFLASLESKNLMSENTAVLLGRKRRRESYDLSSQAMRRRTESQTEFQSALESPRISIFSPKSTSLPSSPDPLPTFSLLSLPSLACLPLPVPWQGKTLAPLCVVQVVGTSELPSLPSPSTIGHDSDDMKDETTTASDAIRLDARLSSGKGNISAPTAPSVPWCKSRLTLADVNNMDLKLVEFLAAAKAEIDRVACHDWHAEILRGIRRQQDANKKGKLKLLAFVALRDRQPGEAGLPQHAEAPNHSFAKDGNLDS